MLMRPRNFILRFALTLLSLATCVAAYSAQCSVLILCSYSQETNSLTRTVDSFEAELNAHAVRPNVVLETLSIENLSDVKSWKSRMISILDKYRTPSKRPDVLVLLGQDQ